MASDQPNERNYMARSDAQCIELGKSRLASLPDDLALFIIGQLRETMIRKLYSAKAEQLFHVLGNVSDPEFSAFLSRAKESLALQQATSKTAR